MAFVLVLLLTRWVALASVAAAVTLILVAVVVTVVGSDPLEGRRLVWAIVLGCIVIYRHRANFVTRWRARRSQT